MKSLIVLTLLPVAIVAGSAAPAAAAGACTPLVFATGVCASADTNVIDRNPSSVGKDVTSAESVTAFTIFGALPICIGRATVGYEVANGPVYDVNGPYLCY